jgi:hypothetical protein
MKLILNITAVFHLLCNLVACSEGGSQSKKPDKGILLDTTVRVCSDYPSSIDSLKLQTLYDGARWYIYAWHCDLPYKR